MKEIFESKLLRVTKLFISMGYFLCSRARNIIRALMGKLPPGECIVVHYHTVAPEHRKRFAWQLDFLKRHATPIAADHQQPLQPGQRYAAVTFDDGFMTAVENAVPELMQRNIPMTFFIPAGLLGTSPQWPGYGPSVGGDEIIATAECLRQLPRDLITFGSHTMTHPWLPSLSDDEAKLELAASRAELKTISNRDITLFSFPYGAFNQHLVELCREAGYERVFSVMPVPALTNPQEFLTGRVAVNPTDWKLEFRLKILGAYQWLPRVIGWKRKLLGKHFDEKAAISQVRKEPRSAHYGLN